MSRKFTPQAIKKTTSGFNHVRRGRPISQIFSRSFTRGEPQHKPTQQRNIALTITFLAGLLIGFGILMVYNVSVVEAFSQFGDKLYFARQQFFWALLAIGVFFISLRIPSKFWIAIGPLAFFGSLMLLAVVLIPGIGVKVGGARRWLDLPFMRFQPAELMKLSLALYLTTWLKKPRSLLSFALLLGILFGLVMLEPDLGTSLILLSIGIAMYFVSGKPIKDLARLVGIGILGVGLLVLISPYRMERIKTFLNPESDPLGKSYHIHQITIALGNGGVFGQGLGKSIQKYRYIPEATTDSIFAIIAEEVGFIGSIVIITTFFALFVFMMKFVKTLENDEHKLLGMGLVIWLISQVVVNLSSIVVLIPLTGVPLPFISYGGSALVSEAWAIGILLGLSRTNREMKRR